MDKLTNKTDNEILAILLTIHFLTPCTTAVIVIIGYVVYFKVALLLVILT
jgi:hypothetical protein